jgi:hypothetical protein
LHGKWSEQLGSPRKSISTIAKANKKRLGWIQDRAFGIVPADQDNPKGNRRNVPLGIRAGDDQSDPGQMFEKCILVERPTHHAATPGDSKRRFPTKSSEWGIPSIAHLTLSTRGQ